MLNLLFDRLHTIQLKVTHNFPLLDRKSDLIPFRSLIIFESGKMVDPNRFWMHYGLKNSELTV